VYLLSCNYIKTAFGCFFSNVHLNVFSWLLECARTGRRVHEERYCVENDEEETVQQTTNVIKSRSSVPSVVSSRPASCSRDVVLEKSTAGDISKSSSTRIMRSVAGDVVKGATSAAEDVSVSVASRVMRSATGVVSTVAPNAAENVSVSAASRVKSTAGVLSTGVTSGAAENISRIAASFGSCEQNEDGNTVSKNIVNELILKQSDNVPQSVVIANSVANGSSNNQVKLVAAVGDENELQPIPNLAKEIVGRNVIQKSIKPAKAVLKNQIVEVRTTTLVLVNVFIVFVVTG